MLIDLASRMRPKNMGKIHYDFTHAPPVEMDGVDSVYLNVPLCYYRCSYRPFYSEPFAKHASILDVYLEAMRVEIQQSQLKGRPQWMYIGGGKDLTAKGKMLAHEISRAGMEALPFPIQYPASVDNLPDFQFYCQKQPNE